MKLARHDRSLIAWMLYVSILFSAFVCATGHGQMAGLQLSGLGGQFCSLDGNAGSTVDLDGSGSVAMPSPASGGCTLGSLFSAIIVAALFGLLGLLAADRTMPLHHLLRTVRVRYRWPAANPRASPAC